MTESGKGALPVVRILCTTARVRVSLGRLSCTYESGAGQSGGRLQLCRGEH